MAHYALIDGYLDTMRSEIRWQKDLDDVVSEMEDHLYSTVEHLVASGYEPDAAQRTTLDRFGEPKVLAAVYASTTTGGIAVPTRNTIRAGTISLFAGGLWLAAGLIYLLTRAEDSNGGDNWQVYYAIFSAAILTAGVLTILAMVGVSKRSGGLGTLGMIGLGVAALGVAGSILAWAIPLWMSLQGAGLLLFGIAAMRNGTAPKPATMLAMLGFPVGIISFAALNAAEVGSVDSYGDHPLAWAIGAAIGMVIVAIGLIGWGRWLRAEEPADIDATAIPA
jgi:hypothetical protein